MSRNFRPDENTKRAKGRRAFAMERNELRQPSSPRTPATGPTSMAMKVTDPGDALLIEAWLKQNGGDK